MKYVSVQDLVEQNQVVIKTGPFGTQLKASEYVSFGTPVLNVRNLGFATVNTDKLEMVSDGTLERLSAHKLVTGDIVFGRKGAVERHAFISESENGWMQGSDCIRLRVLADSVNPRFLSYYFLTKRHRAFMMSMCSHGTTMASLNQKIIEKIIVPLPERSIQDKVVEILATLDKQIVTNQKINENLRQQAQALFKKWFVDNPDAILWKEGTFSNLIEKTISGDWGKDSPSGNNTEMVYCIRGADIPEVRAGNKGKMPTRYILPKNYAAKQLVDGDIVVEISGGSPTQSTGRAAAVSDALLARYDKGMVCTNFCKALKPRAGYSMYVYYYWQYLYDRDIFFSYENGTTGIKNLDINGFIETEPIVIAPEDLVEKFDAVCQTVFSKIYANGMENEQLALVRDTILPKLMSGEIDDPAMLRLIVVKAVFHLIPPNVNDNLAA